MTQEEKFYSKHKYQLTIHYGSDIDTTFWASIKAAKDELKPKKKYLKETKWWFCRTN
jgi:hypothetical protein